MSNPETPSPEPVDRGTRVGTATGALAGLLFLPVRVGTRARREWHHLAAAVVHATRVTAAAARRRRRWVLGALGALALVAGTAVAVTVPGAPDRLLTATRAGGLFLLGAAIAAAGVVGTVALGYVVVVIGRRCRRPARAIGRAVRRFAAFLGHQLASVLVVVRPLASWVARRGRTTLAAGGAFLRLVVSTLARTLAALLAGACSYIVACARWCGAPLAATGRVVGRLVTSAGRCLARVALVVTRPFASWVGARLRALRRAFDRIRSAVSARVRRVGRSVAARLRPLGPPLAHALQVVADGISRACGRVIVAVAAVARPSRSWCVSVERRIVYSIGVAVVRTRHRTQALVQPAPPSRSVAVTVPVVPFDVEVHQNEYVPRGGTEVHAVVRVTANGAPPRSDIGPEAAEVILLDCSGSMGMPWSKLRAAREATAAAVDALRDGTWFAIVRANHGTTPVYPSQGLAPACEQTRSAARDALRSCWPEGGTAMGRWLLCARDLFATRPGAIPHAILLTDGRNESETGADLERSLTECRGRFQVDCRGVGTDWDVSELRTISSNMLGTLDIVARPSGLDADFRSMTESAMRKSVAGTTLSVWVPHGARLRYVREVSPEVRDLTPLGRTHEGATTEFPIGAWGDESRDYHVCVDVPAQAVGEEMLAARLTVTAAGQIVSKALVRAIWSDDEAQSTRIDRRVAHYTGQTELAEAIQEGLRAREAGDDEVATARLARATTIARVSGNLSTLALLRRVIEVDETTGTVRLRERVSEADEMALDVGSTRTVRVAVTQ
jgi:hypothetical protein